ncbi:amino acid permease [Bacillus marasmi]|uniref:amino acid permease n=1 Tax=Bacillus marasmi TaxID=1926279 RepID=UPI0011CACBBA|nr:amino acid permease [Bacillus marasmi]
MAKQANGSQQNEKPLEWWQLSLIGVGCIIGTGYFLGSGLGIKMTGPSMIFGFIVAAIGTYVVFDALSKMYAKDPQKGSFRSYAKKAFGRWAGFSSGWVYWFSELLIMGSQLTALSIFTKFWFPHLPLWVFASIYAVLGIIVVLTGTKGFERMENVFAVVKIAAIFMFIILAGAGLFGMLDVGKEVFRTPKQMNDYFPAGFKGLWSALIFAFYAFGGIEIMGIMSVRLRNKKDAAKAGKIMIILLTTIYLISIGLAVTMVPWQDFNAKESPFVIAMGNYKLGFFPHVFNGALIIAGFSTMSASLFAVTSMLVTLAEDGDAPKLFAKQGKLKVPMYAMFLTVAGLVTSIVLALVMPDTIYEYITTAAGLMLLYNWLFVLVSVQRLIKLTLWDQLKRFIGMVFILLAVSGTLFQDSIRPGFLVSIGFVIFIGIVSLMIHFFAKKKGGSSRTKPVFEKLVLKEK